MLLQQCSPSDNAVGYSPAFSHGSELQWLSWIQQQAYWGLSSSEQFQNWWRKWIGRYISRRAGRYRYFNGERHQSGFHQNCAFDFPYICVNACTTWMLQLSHRNRFFEIRVLTFPVIRKGTILHRSQVLYRTSFHRRMLCYGFAMVAHLIRRWIYRMCQ